MSKKFKPYFTATVKGERGDGVMTWDDGEKEKVKRHLGSLQYKTTDTKIKVTIDRYRDDNNTRQLRYLWGVIYPLIGEVIGVAFYDYGKEIELPLKIKYLGHGEILQDECFKIFENNNKYQPRKEVSVSELSTGELTDFIDDVRGWAKSDLGLYIPLPNEGDYESLPENIPNF